MFTHSNTPNHTRSMPSFAATGASSGTMMKAISKKSRKKARKNTKRLTMIRKVTLSPPVIEISMCSIQTPPSTPWKTSEKTVDPIRMKMTIAVSRMVDSMPSRISFQLSRLCMAASTIAPTAPIAPASVGVARPRKIVPSTRKIRTIEGTMPQSTRFQSAQP